MKIRTIITQDAEVDDQNSLRHFLFYANEVELQGIVQTSSKFHWRGVPGTTRKAIALEGEFGGDGHDDEPFDKPWRWTGTEWMQRVINDYEKDYPNLVKQSADYPTPDYLRSITKVGNVGYKGEMDTPTEGSELIRRVILDDDERTLYLQVWGGCNTIARALMDIETEYAGSPQWPALHEKLMKKIFITACGEQDETFRTYIAEAWPRIPFVKTLQMGSYAYGWCSMPEGESKDCLRAPFMEREILRSGSALAAGYCTWMDGKDYEGEHAPGQFGSNPNILNEWFGARFGLKGYQKYDFLSEGDSPTFFVLMDWGFRTLENFAWGGLGGRYFRQTDQFNSKGEALDMWDICKDSYTDRSGAVVETESMWPYVEDIQRDFAARVHWAAGDSAEHAPCLQLAEGVDFTAAPGETVTLTAEANAPVSFRVYEEISAPGAVLVCDGSKACVTVPADAKPGDSVHVIVKAESTGHFRLTRYQQAVICVK